MTNEPQKRTSADAGSADELLPESVRRYHEEAARRQAEHEREVRINIAWNEASSFVEDDAQRKESFYAEWADRFVTLGAVLSEEGLAGYLDELESRATGELARDAFAFGVRIYREAVAGNRSEVERLLRAAGDAPSEFFTPVGHAIRAQIVPMLRDRRDGPMRTTAEAGADVPAAEPQSGTPTPVGESPESPMRLSVEARALGVLAEHPDWTVKRIAEAIGTNPKYLSSLDRFKAARRAIRESGRDDLRRGSKSADGEIEAWE